MRKRRFLALCTGVLLLLNACAAKSDEKTVEEANTGMQNPWNYFDSLSEAEDAAGFSLDLPEVIDDSYKATAFGVMDGEMVILEVVYENKNAEVIVRKARGEGNDISGVYGDCEADVAEEMLLKMDYDGYSWSFYAPEPLEEGGFEQFTEALYE